ncbi:RsmB/NOP family class I SAM-dependent RNA methyltransferase [Chitinophaga pinensis]|uniref:Fmu (Sun) domain protein n=1 Tax=Chitinophaga pinensis (strain ATCC 43595 / DSM 2588 / LMG 13176 / NBRC 15968 / NCIMB 11800 / UQM 2034) TaxID=485918 RepID=A0A979GB21_CHIPD|nr:RsmB/NOP family class I SAM-dependent RNA methyltransferase [Chitinophaga pinensis]ACU64239.1 Fmu (Sun) domain protein [Chitinophaga pinensis DSM 2588]
MTRWENYIASAEKIIVSYDGSLPLHHFLKGFFKQHPYMGSRDRRQISQLVYQYYRLGQLWQQEKSMAERILLGTFLCEKESSDLLQFFRPELNEKVSLPVAEKLAFLDITETTTVFPFTAALSAGIDGVAFNQSFFIQPDLFIRTRHNRQSAILRQLEKADIPYTVIGEDTIALPNSTKIDTVITDKSWYEIQDASSQQVGALFTPKAGELWWDSCAASGGKSILLLDKQPGVKLLVSDVRASIIQNLHQRFKEAGIRQYESIVMDLTAPVTSSAIKDRLFDHIILDAPCSGSGTWGRTPENMSFFTEKQITEYQQLQQKIAANIVHLLKPGGTLIYITCSVFRQENEEVVAFLEKGSGLKQQEGGVIAGYAHRADSMFAVKLIKQ